MTDKEEKSEIEKTKKVMIINSTFEVFTPGSQLNESLTRLKLQVIGKDALALRRFILTITESPEFKAYEEMRAEIVQKFMDEQKGLPEKVRRPPMALNIPQWINLMNMESRLVIEKFKVKVSEFPDWDSPEKAFNAHDMDYLDGLFEFI